MTDARLNPVEERILEILSDNVDPDNPEPISFDEIVNISGFTKGQVMMSLNVLNKLGFVNGPEEIGE